MNVIFLDFDGVLDTAHLSSDSDIEKRIETLSRIVKKYNCKVVIEASCKVCIDEETLEIDPDSEWIKNIFLLFKKYNIEVIGRTPSIRKILNNSYIDIWKDAEIRLYLFRHPEIEHYCIIDDDTFNDIVQLRDYLVQPKDYCNDISQEGLLEEHDELIGKVLSKKNNIQKFAIAYKNKQLL